MDTTAIKITDVKLFNVLNSTTQLLGCEVVSPLQQEVFNCNGICIYVLKANLVETIHLLDEKQNKQLSAMWM